MQKTKTFTVEGVTFEAVRYQIPIPHWRLRLPTGEILNPGTSGLSSESVPKMKADMEYLVKRFGKAQLRGFFPPTV